MYSASKSSLEIQKQLTHMHLESQSQVGRRLSRNTTCLRYNRASTLQSSPGQQCFQSTIKHRPHAQKLSFCYGNNTDTSNKRAFLGSRVQMGNQNITTGSLLSWWNHSCYDQLIHNLVLKGGRR